MKTTIDLPSDLVRKLKLRAIRENRHVKDLAADLLRAGLSVPVAPPRQAPKIKKHPTTGFPVIQGNAAIKSPPSLTPEQIDDVLLQQEVEWSLGTSRR